MNNQIQRFREYTNAKGGRHRLLAEAALEMGKATLNWDYLRKVKFFPHHSIKTTLPLHQKNQYGRTFFKEVQTAPPRMTEAVKHYVQNPKPKLEKKPLKKLIQIIERDWNSNIFNVDLHSSGYDSRLISGILMKLREKHGEGWIGDIVFLCWEPDGAHFKKIMKWEGWRESQYHVYREGIGIDYRAEVVDFKNVWRWVNDYSLPHYCAGPMVEEAIKKGLIPKDAETCLIMGLSSTPFVVGEMLKKYKNKLFDELATDRLSQSIYAAMSAIPFTNTFIPFLDIELASTFVLHETRMRLVKQLSQPLYNLRRYQIRAAYSKPNWLNAPRGLSKETRIKAAKSYNASWFARETKQPEIQVSPDLNFGLKPKQDRWWRNYVLASTCEYLINQGVKVRWK